MNRARIFAVALMSLLPVTLHAQPSPAPGTPDLPCGAAIPSDTLDAVASRPDSEDFRPLFDGTFKGWFQSCETGHSSRDRSGASFRVGTADGRPALYTQIRGNAGGVMMTQRTFANYELRFQIWPDYGNESGIFNRTPVTGSCLRTSLTYAQGGTLGGTWSEGGFLPHRDLRPFAFGSEDNIAVPGNSSSATLNWTRSTRDIKAVGQPDLPCPESGCTQADWNRLWDKDGWNEIRIQFYGGASGSGKIHIKSWFKKPMAESWVPILQDTTLNAHIRPGHIGILVYGGGERFTGTQGTWYRDIRYRELDDKGDASTGTFDLPRREERVRMRLSADAHRLAGVLDRDYAITVEDFQGRRLESFGGKAGNLSHDFITASRGLMVVRIRTALGVETRRLVRPF